MITHFQKTISISFFLLALFPAILLGFEPIDISKADFFARKGFHQDWVLEKTNDQNWITIPGRENGFRPIQIRKLGLSNDRQHRLFSFKTYEPETYSLVTMFNLSDHQIPQNGSLGLYLGAIGVNWEIYLNGTRIRKEIYLDDSGKIVVARNLTNHTIEMDNHLLRLGENRLFFRIIGDPTDPETGFYIGDPFIIDRYSTLLKQKREPFNLVLISLYCFIGLFFLLLFIKSPKEKIHLFFGLFCILFFTYKFSLSSVFQDFSHNTLLNNRIEYGSLYLLIPCLLGFTDHLTRDHISRFSKGYIVFSLILFSFCLWAPLPFLFDLLRLWQFTAAVPLLYALFRLSCTWYESADKSSLFKDLFLSSRGNLLLGVLISIALGATDIIRSLFYMSKVQVSQYGFILITCYMGYALIKRLNQSRVNLINSQNEVAANRQLAIDNLQKADKLKDEFLANTSHELRTPIHGIIGIAEAALDRYQENQTSSIKNALGTIITSARRLSILINDILDYAKLKEGDLPFDIKAIDLSSVTEVVLSLTKPLSEAKQLELHNEIPTGIFFVFADESRLYQILQNLIGNAVKFTAKGSITLSANRNEGQVILSVADTGVGIPKEKTEEIFQSFQQGDGSVSRSFGGSGLGLSITKKLVELQQGNIWVESQPGIGSTFYLSLPASDHLSQESTTLPKTQVIQEMREDKNITPKISNGYQILVVDDDPVNRQILDQFLSNDGYTAIMASSGEEAMNLIEEKTPDLILLDIMMPEISGFDLCRQIRQEYPKDQLPVLFLSAKNQVSDLTEGFAFGANDYITKPFSKNELLTRIHFHLELSRHVEISSRRLHSLRSFASDITKFKNPQHLSKAIFQQLESQIDATMIVCYLNNKPAYQSVESELPPFLQNRLSQGEIENRKGTGWFHPFSIDTLEDYHFLLYRDYTRKDFDRSDLEFISNLKQEACQGRKNIQAFIQDEATLRKFLDLQAKLDQIYFIQADRQYARGLFKNGRELVDLDWSLGEIESYFDEKDLLRVHKSFIINPKYPIQALRKKGARDYVLSFTSPEMKEVLENLSDFNGIKLARSKEQQCKKIYPHWFELS